MNDEDDDPSTYMNFVGGDNFGGNGGGGGRPGGRPRGEYVNNAIDDDIAVKL